MEFWDTVKAAIVANLIALTIAPTLWVAAYVALKKYGNRVRDSLARSAIKISLTSRFYWLALARRKDREEYRSWITAETHRRLFVELMVQAPKTPIYFMEGMADAFSALEREQWERARPRYAKNLLLGALGSLSPKHFETLLEDSEDNFESLPQHERANWLCSQPYSQIAKWAILISERDRAAWRTWLTSSDATREIEDALESNASEESVS